MMRRLITLLLCLFAFPATAQTVATPAPAASPAAALPRVVLETTAGRFVIEVETVKAPVTAANFLRYVDHHKLDGVEFYRIVRFEARYGLLQFGTLGDPKRSYPPIKHEPTTLTGLSHVDGTISMARSEPGTAQGDFTLMIGDQTSLDATSTDVGYAAFGHVVEGMDVVVTILNGEISPTATRNSGYKGEVPVAPVKVLTAHRLLQPPSP
jgi:peptidyl-prolyl cis-trans isomerase A (cyclophilin A)